jgi:hypothetical protein
MMKLPRRRFLHLAVGAAVLPAVSRIARAQTYPARPVRFIVGFTPGGSFDITARLIGQWLSERLGQQFVIENRPGAAGNIASEAAVKSPADGYTILLCGVPNAISATLYDKLNYDFSRDIAPVGAVSRAPNVMVVHPSVPAKTAPEFIAYAKANPGKVNMASSGVESGLGAHAHRPPRRASPDRLRQPAALHAPHQRRQAARTGGDDGDAVARAAGPADGSRFRARLRSEHMEWRVRAEEYAGRDR